MSRSLNDLHPEMRERVTLCITEWAILGLDVLITCTYRGHAEQQALYDQGRSKPGRIVTRAKPGQSAHNYTVDGQPASLAIDVVPMRNGKCVWGTTGADLELWQAVAKVAKAHGLQWYGEPDAPFREYAHFQLPNASELLRK